MNSTGRAAIFLKLVGAGLIAGAVPVLAHHSYAMFDRTRQVKLKGVVRLWEFSNPHGFLWIYVNDEKGVPQLWGLEAPGPGELVRRGWTKSTVKPGDPITVTINPLRDGRHGGNLTGLVLADGRTMGTAGVGPPNRAKPGGPGAPGAGAPAPGPGVPRWTTSRRRRKGGDRDNSETGS